MIPVVIAKNNFHNFELTKEHMKHTLVYSMISSIYDVVLPNPDQTNFFQITGLRGETKNANLKPVFLFLDTGRKIEKYFEQKFKRSALACTSY